MEENPLLDLFAKHLFKNVKRRRLTEDEKRRLRNVTHEIQTHLDSLTRDRGTDKQKASANKPQKPRRRLTLRRND
ncbi:hypothetical protein [Tumebacillus permanentifrigoris]|uniref:Uncharacterized protein n=1 Tax=Tumebacillus permanentifrigoris TaxID=378543 RepID=A0A316D8S8_9BACL|nr:hypothetical protein [Tumebacillus permanentifrigoris]PWK07412.1 hypothetical protein C7459_11710 [Tumebacillus permanentifrigoris]